MGPMGLQCDKLQRGDLDNYCSPYKKNVEATARLVTCLQPTGSKKRGHTKADNMLKRHRRTTLTLRLACVIRICITTAEDAKAGCIAGSVASGHTMHVSGMSVAGLCANG